MKVRIRTTSSAVAANVWRDAWYVGSHEFESCNYSVLSNTKGWDIRIAPHVLYTITTSVETKAEKLCGTTVRTGRSTLTAQPEKQVPTSEDATRLY